MDYLMNRVFTVHPSVTQRCKSRDDELAGLDALPESRGGAASPSFPKIQSIRFQASPDMK